MIPRTISATSLQVANLCMARWEAEYLDRTPGFSGVAANIGTAVHGGLEKFVKLCYIDKTHDPSEPLLIDLYNIAYVETFQSADLGTPEYRDGLALTRKWYKRTEITSEVLSVEVKETIPVPYTDPATGNIGEVPLNYVIDRLDKIGEHEYEVVDYKTVRVPINPEDLHQKIQARIYALAVQIKFPDAKKIKVTFDLLRHERVSTYVTRDDNVKTWHWLKAELDRIVKTETNPRPTLNMECGYCVMKASCPVLIKNIDGRGIHSLPLEQVAQLKADLDAQTKAQELLASELDDLLLRHAVEVDSLEYEVGDLTVEVKAQRRRYVDPPTVAEIIGQQLFSQLGKINIGSIETLLNGDELNPEQKQALKDHISYQLGEPHAKVKPKKVGL